MKKRPDSDYLYWLTFQPSALDGTFSEWDEKKQKFRNIAAHVRRSNNSGIATKPVKSAIPLTKVQHDLQHQKGELAMLMAYCNFPRIYLKYSGVTPEQAAKEYVVYLAVSHFEKYTKERDLWRKMR